MSLRRRLAIIVALAAATLIIAAIAITHVLETSGRARASAGAATADAAAAGLAAAFARADIASVDTASPHVLRALTDSAVAAVGEGRVGFCTRHGAVTVMSAIAPFEPRGAPAKPLPPDQTDAVVAVCRNASPDARASLEHPHDSMMLSGRRVAGDGAAWALVRVARETDPSPWRTDVFLLACMTLFMVAVTVGTSLSLGRGVRDLEAALHTLKGNLRAPVPPAASREFATLTVGLTAMAEHLAGARDRELALVRDLAHRERLAGMGRVVAGVAHEIRNPLAGIKLRLDVMQRAGITDSDGVRSCLEEIERLDRVVQTLLTVARKSSITDNVNLAALADERLRHVAAEADKKEIVLIRRGDVKAACDRDGLARVIDNLLRNALEAGPDGGTIAITLHGDDTTATVDVSDQGPGVSEKVASTLFEPFMTTKAGGTGLGLWMSRSLVESQGGSLVYARDEGRTIFRVRLPVNRISP